jgi:predicted dehydrogenase
MGNRPLRFGLIGCGRVAHYHARALAKLDDAELVIVCDIVPERADEYARLYGGEAVYDYRRVLERSDVDVVCIATPSGGHPAIGIDAARAGKHVVVEKPIGLTLTEIDALIEACDDAGVKLCAVHQNRFNPPIRRLRKALDQGRFGRLSHAAVAVRWNRDQDYYEQAEWRGTWVEDGGALMNQSVHGIDLLRWMAGEPDSLGAFTATQFRSIETEDVGVAAIRFKSGALGVIEASNNVYPSNWEETLTIFGEHGSVSIGGVAVNRVERWEFSDGSNGQDLVDEPDPASVYGSGHGPLLEAMINAIRTDGAPPVTGQHGRAAVELVLAIYRSQETGNMIRFPLTEESSRIAKARGLAPKGNCRW